MRRIILPLITALLAIAAPCAAWMAPPRIRVAPPPLVWFGPPAVSYQPAWIPPHWDAWGRWIPGHWR